MPSVITVTAGPRRPPKRASSDFSNGQVATTSMVAQIVAAINGRKTQSEAAISSRMQMIASVVRVRSWRTKSCGELPVVVVDAGGGVYSRSSGSPAFSRPSTTSWWRSGELDVPADQGAAAAREVGLRREQLGHLHLRLLEPAEMSQAAGPHHGPQEEGRVAVLQGGLVGLLELPPVHVIEPEGVWGDRDHVGGIEVERSSQQGGAALPVAEQRHQPADPLEVDQGVGVDLEGALDPQPGGGELTLGEESPGERGPGPLAGRVEAYPVLGVGDGLVDGSLEGRDLERVVRVVQTRQLDPGQAALGLRGHDAPQGLDRRGRGPPGRG